MLRKSILGMFLLAVLGPVGSAFAGEPDLIAWYKFNGNAQDSSGNGLHGTEYGSPVYAEGRYGMAIDMDGVDDYIDCGNDSKFNITKAITISYWFTVEAFDRGWNTIIAKGDGSWRSSRAGENNYMECALSGTSGDSLFSSTPVDDGLWHHAAFTFDGTTTKTYIDGVLETTEASTGTISISGYNVYIGDNSQATGRYWHGKIDELRIYSRALPQSEILEVMAGRSPEQAQNPSPEKEATDVPRDVVLSWTTGECAATHNVYFGTNFDSVNDGSDDVLVSEGQTDAVYDPDGLLEYGQTYYWRVDEVNAAPDYTVFESRTWSFTTETYSYPITNLTVTASTEQGNSLASYTIDNSGLNEYDQHGVDLSTMWCTPSGGVPAWIQYEFDKQYNLYELWVWNSNSQIEGVMGMGAKDVVIEYSTDGETWTELENVPAFAQGTGAATYTANTIIDFGGAAARYVKLTINSNWGVTPMASLSEVRFYHVPFQAFEPDPADGDTEVAIDTTLNWRPGREATSHTVYIDTDASVVAEGLVSGSVVTDHSYMPALDFSTTYYWKVDEVRGADTYAGNLWSFTTEKFNPVDDFESYDDDIDAKTTIWQTWTDGLTNGENGSQVGYDESPFAEQSIVHGGNQSMPLTYDNSSSPYYSQAERTFDTAQDWTAHGADTLNLHFRGIPPAFEETSSGTVLMNAIGSDIWGSADYFRFAYKSLSGNGAIIARVDSLYAADGYTKGGVMIRQNTDSGSINAFMAMIPGTNCNGAQWQYRLTGGNSSDGSHAPELVKVPYWVKIERTGSTFSGYISPDGATWTQIGKPQTISMNDPVLIGLALTSHNSTKLTRAEFSNIEITGVVTGSWQIAEIGATQQEGNSVEPVYLTVKDSSGKSATIVNSDSYATSRIEWQHWLIPLSDFTSAGVKVTAIKSLVIGTGSKTSPSAGGTGTIYIDDIGVGCPLE